ncbi:ECF family sigma-70 type sigma factor [Streptomyces ambofaciens ATCC 23877]|uniref:ECF family sigma-70 type sigma factor n=1 Tax=Streptomyces ambofaciens (strain ATCC 23877 / 3486 / DSM 40053 / JCM 4204 / NBRC 12836 / NRRL B-2516) TaxID=278992 RepID=A0A0K2ATV9_STRA7|nr:RNA polymerase sigma-70 factor [Streptomyces ambofaciens]AKZ56262.1 ECF family sigma-70 type sigma factor [Streptomyces ambofaciens ATCC 23877]
MGEGSERADGGTVPVHGGGTDAATGAFVAHRALLFTVAYEMLGSAADAEDVLQETWLRWVNVDLGQVREPRAYLVRIATRQAIDRLRTLSRRREAYVGPWLPEPLLTAPDVAENVELAESVSMAMLLVLETLAPVERAVFVLREVFELDYGEIAEAVGKSPAAVRQIAYRARGHVAARRPRTAISPAETRAALEAFRHAVASGDLQTLIDILAPEVVYLGDGGGARQATPRPVVGAGDVARLLVLGLPTLDGAFLETVQINGCPALLVRRGEEVDGVVTMRVENGLITAFYSVRNPEKLAHVERETALSR